MAQSTPGRDYVKTKMLNPGTLAGLFKSHLALDTPTNKADYIPRKN
jgi:hypothetical protein